MYILRVFAQLRLFAAGDAHSVAWHSSLLRTDTAHTGILLPAPTPKDKVMHKKRRRGDEKDEVVWKDVCSNYDTNCAANIRIINQI